MSDEHDSREDDGKRGAGAQTGSSGEDRLVEMMNPSRKSNKEKSGIPWDGW